MNNQADLIVMAKEHLRNPYFALHAAKELGIMMFLGSTKELFKSIVHINCIYFWGEEVVTPYEKFLGAWAYCY